MPSLHEQAQKKEEIFILENFFSVMGIQADSINEGPKVNGNSKPDYIANIKKRPIGIELTRYYMSQKPSESQPRQVKESAREKLLSAIEKARRNCEELNETNGIIKFSDFILPSSKEYTLFADELVQFARSKMGDFGDGYKRKRYKPSGGEYPHLKHLEYLELEQVGCYMSWDWMHNAAFVGLKEDELFNIINAKCDRHVRINVVEDWLLITSETETSQQMGYLFIDEMNKFQKVLNLLNRSPFAKVYIYDYMRSKVRRWTKDKRWEEINLSLS